MQRDRTGCPAPGAPGCSPDMGTSQDHRGERARPCRQAPVDASQKTRVGTTRRASRFGTLHHGSPTQSLNHREILFGWEHAQEHRRSREYVRSSHQTWHAAGPQGVWIAWCFGSSGHLGTLVSGRRDTRSGGSLFITPHLHRRPELVSSSCGLGKDVLLVEGSYLQPSARRLQSEG